MNNRHGDRPIAVAFFGSDDFSLPTLQILSQDSQITIPLIFTQAPKQSGRGQKTTPTIIEQFASNHCQTAKIFTPSKLSQEHADLIIQNHIDVIVVVSYGLLLPQVVLDTVKHSINLHPSHLPLFRGAAPIERMIESGIEHTKICVINMTKQLDAGDIVASEPYNITLHQNSIDARLAMALHGSKLIHKVICESIKYNSIIRTPQNHTEASYASKITKEELTLTLNSSTKTTRQVLNAIRAFASCGYCSVIIKTTKGERRIKILSAKIELQQQTICDVICSDGYVTPTRVKPDGKGEMLIRDFLNGL